MGFPVLGAASDQWFFSMFQYVMVLILLSRAIVAVGSEVIAELQHWCELKSLLYIPGQMALNVATFWLQFQVFNGKNRVESSLSLGDRVKAGIDLMMAPNPEIWGVSTLLNTDRSKLQTSQQGFLFCF